VHDGQSAPGNSAHSEKKTCRYRERDEAKRQAFLETLAAYLSEQMVYLDESGADNTLDYPYGWCHQSKRFEADKLGHRTCRISMIAAWWNGHLLAPMTFKEYCNSALVETWVEYLLVPTLQPGQVVTNSQRSFV
jgi:hypothetical protein